MGVLSALNSQHYMKRCLGVELQLPLFTFGICCKSKPDWSWMVYLSVPDNCHSPTCPIYRLHCL